MEILQLKTSYVNNEASELWGICKDEYNLIDLLIDDFEHYWEKVRLKKKFELAIEIEDTSNKHLSMR